MQNCHDFLPEYWIATKCHLYWNFMASEKSFVNKRHWKHKFNECHFKTASIFSVYKSRAWINMEKTCGPYGIMHANKTTLWRVIFIIQRNVSFYVISIWDKLCTTNAFKLINKNIYITDHMLLRERETLSLSSFLRTEDIGVHIVHISRLIITYTLE